MKILRIISALILAALVLSPVVNAASYHVATNGDDTSTGDDWNHALATISNGVAKAGGGDTVWVSNGVYMLSETIRLMTNLTVRGTNGMNVTFVGMDRSANLTNCFFLTSNSVLDGFTITNGYAVDGGGVWMSNATLQNCQVMQNFASSNGGGVFLAAGLITNCTISRNTLSNMDSQFILGGGIYARGGGIWNSTISTNMVYATNSYCGGGGIGVPLGTVDVVNCMILSNIVVSNNTYRIHGGGILATYTSSGHLLSSTVSVNVVAFGCGGGMADYSTIGGWIVSNCLFFGNQAGCSIVGFSGGGGGLYVISESGTHIFTDCRFITNKTLHSCDGGGVSFRSTSAMRPSVINSIFSNNTAAGGNGGGVNMAYNAVLANCTLANNSSKVGGGIYMVNSANIVTNCIIRNNTTTESSGGICSYHSSGANTAINCLVEGNISAGNAGGIRIMSDGKFTMVNCTVVSNFASGKGGGIYDTRTSIFQNVIAYFNQTASDPSSNYYGVSVTAIAVFHRN
jgi:hypothetical protein